MTRLHQALVGALLAQAALGVLTWWPDSGAALQLHPLYKVDRGTITALTLTGTPKDGQPPNPVRLEKEGGSWVLRSMAGYPADETKVGEVLDKLSDIQVRSPIATRPEDHGTLEVGERSWSRKVEITADGKSTTLYLGAATSQSAHVRMAGSDEVYEVRGLSAWSIGDTDRRFFDPIYAEVKADAVRSFSVTSPTGAFQVDGDGETWTALDLPAGAQVDGEKVKKLLKKLGTIRMVEPVAREVRPEFGLEAGTTIRWATEGEDGSTATGALQVGALVDGSYYVKAEEDPWVVKVREGSLKDVMNATLEGLLVSGE